MKKNLIPVFIFLLVFINSVVSFAQYYPGGFAHSKISLWYDAADTNTFTRTSNDSTLTKWTDKSNGIIAAQTTAAYQPVLSTQDGKNIVEFTNMQQLTIPATSLLAPQNGYNIAQVIHVYPDARASVTYSGAGTFQSSGSTQGSPNIGVRYNTYLNGNKYEITACRNNTGYYYYNYNDLRGQWVMSGNYTSGNLPTNSNNAYSHYYYNGGGTLSSNTATLPIGTPTAGIGNRANAPQGDSVHWGVSETVLAGYDTKNSGRRIIDLYLAAKWGMLDTLNTYWGYGNLFYPTSPSFINNLVGIGTEGGSDSTTYTGSNNGLGLQNINGITGFLRSAGSYVMAADNGLTGTVAMGTSFTRWNRAWFVNKTDVSGYGGLMNIFFDFNNYATGGTLDTVNNSYYLLYNPSSGYFSAGQNYLIPLNSYQQIVGTNQLTFLLDGLNMSNGFYTIIYAPKGSPTTSIPLLTPFSYPTLTISPAPLITSVYSGNTYNYVLIDSSSITYPVAYYKIYRSVNGGTSTVLDSTAFYTTTTTPKYYADYNLTNGNTYTYTVTAVYAPGKESVLSSAVSGTPNNNTPTWSITPQYSGSGQVFMSASAPLAGLPLKFNFNNVSGGGHSSGYQVSPNYTDSLLTNGNTYSYRFEFMDTVAGVATQSGWSSTLSVLVADSAQGGFTYNMTYLDLTTMFAPYGIGPATTVTPANQDMSSLGYIRRAPAVGVHPRILCNPDDSTSIRWRLVNTNSGRAAAKWIHSYTTLLQLGYNGYSKTSNYNLDTMGNMYITNTGANDVKALYDSLAAGDIGVTNNYSNLWGNNYAKMAYLFSKEALECWLYKNTIDPVTNTSYVTRAQKLAKAIAVWAKKIVADPTIKPNIDMSNFGGLHMSYVYDYLYDQMTKGQQDTVRMAIIKTLPDSSQEHGFQAPSVSITSNWSTFGGEIFENISVEGEPGYAAKDSGLLRGWIRGVWDFVTYGIYPTGNMYEGNGKNRLNMSLLYAMARRGYSVLGNPSVRNYGKKYLPAITQPFGYSFVGTDILGGTGYQSPSTGGWNPGWVDIGPLKYILPKDSSIDFVWKSLMQKPYANFTANIPSLIPYYYSYQQNVNDNYGAGFNTQIPAVIMAEDYFPTTTSNTFSKQEQASLGSNKMYFDSLGGEAIMRSGFDSTSTFVYFACRQDRGGHTFANKNEVLMSGLGRIWFPRVTTTGSGYEIDSVGQTSASNSILVNNLGLSFNPNPSANSIITQSVHPGKMIYFNNGNNMLTIAGDATKAYSYSWNWVGYGGAEYDNTLLSPPSVVKVTETQNSYRYSPFYSSDNVSFYNAFEMTDNITPPYYYLRAVQAPFLNGVFKKMYRTVSLVQAPNPYVIIADDNQLNNNVNNYKWTSPIAQDLVIDQTYTSANLSNTNYKFDVVLKEPSTTGTRRLLVRVLNNNGAVSNTIAAVYDSSIYTKTNTCAGCGLNRIVIESNSVDPQFKVMLFPFHVGDSLPITNWNSDKSKVYIYNAGVTDTIAFTLDANGRTNIALNPIDTGFYWTGAVDSLWSNPANWSTGQVPASYNDVVIPNIDVTKLQNVGSAPSSDAGSVSSGVNSYFPYIMGTPAYARSINIQASASLRMDTTLQLSGDLVNNGTITGLGTIKTSDTSLTPIPTGQTWAVNLEYNNSIGRQTIVAGTYKGLSINGSIGGTSTAAANITVNGIFNVSVNDTLNMGTYTLVGTMTTATGTGTLETQSTVSPCLPTGVTWAGVVDFNNALGGQKVSAGTYQNLILNTTSYKIDNAIGNISVIDTLNIGTKVTLDMGNYSLGGTLNYDTGAGNLRTACTTTAPLPSGTNWMNYVVYYSSSTQNVVPGSYSSLDISGGSNGPRTLDAVGQTGTITLTGTGAVSFVGTTGAVTPNKTTVLMTGNQQQVANMTYYNLNLIGAYATSFNSGIASIKGTFTPGAITTSGGVGTINFSGAIPQVVPPFNYNNLTISGTRTDSVTLPSILSISGNLSYSGLSFATGGIDPSNTKITFNGSGSQTFDGSPSGLSSFVYDSIIVANTGTLTANSNVSISGYLKVATGSTLDLSSYTVGGTFTLANGTGNAGTIKTQNTSAAPLPSKQLYSGTVKYYSTTGTQTIVAATYNNLDISGGTTGGRTLVSGDTIYVSGNYTANSGTGLITPTGNVAVFNGTTTISGSTSLNTVIINPSSTLTAPPAVLNVSGNFVNNGTFNSNSGSVVMNGGNQSISGNNSFNIFTKSVTVPNDTLTFPSGMTQTFTGALTLQGNSSNYLTIISSTSGTQATINPQGGRTIYYLLVKDNLNNNSLAITANSSYNFGDNTNWVFPLSKTYTWKGTSDTKWNNASNWFPPNIPSIYDTAIIAKTGSNNLSIEVSPVIRSMTINSGNTVTLTADTLTLAGNLVNNGTFNGNTGTNIFTGTSTISGTGTTNFNNIVVVDTATLIAPSTTINVSGNFNNQGIFTSGSGTVNFNGTTVMSQAATTQFYNITVGYGASVTAPSGTEDTLNISKNFTVHNTSTFNPNNGTVVLNGTSQSLIDTLTFFNLTTFGTSSVTTGGAAIIVNNNLNISDGTTLTISNTNITVGGATNIGNGTSGTLSFTSSSGTKVFVGTVTVNANGTWANNSATSTGVNFQGGIINNGSFTTGGNYGAATFTTNNQVIGGSKAVNIQPVTVTGITLTNNDSLLVNGALSFTSGGTIVQGTNTYLNIGGTSTATTGITASATGNAVAFTGTTAQTIPAGSYNNLSISGAKTTNNLTLASGTINIAGSYSNNTSFTTGTNVVTGNTVVLNGTANQNIIGTNLVFNNLTVNNTAGDSLQNNVTVAGILTLTAGRLTTGTNALSVTNTASSAVSATTIFGTSAYLNGTLIRSVTSGNTNYVFPVGKYVSGTNYYYPFTINTNNATNASVTVTAFNGSSGGSAGTNVNTLSTNEYWKVFSSNAINATLSVGATDLGSNTLVATYLGTTPAGSYASIGGTANGTNILNTSSASIPAVNQYAYFAMGTSIIAAPTISSVSSCVPLAPTNSFYAMDTLTINGTGFISSGGVSVGGQPATILDATNVPTVLKVLVSSSANTNAVSVSNLGGGANFAGATYIPGYATRNNGEWNIASTWLGGATPTGSSIVATINTLDTLASSISGINAITVTSGAVFITNNIGVTLNSGAILTNNGTFACANTITANGAANVAGSTAITFSNLTINGLLTLNTSSTINGALRINAGGSVVGTGYPTYGSSSTVQYNTGGTIKPGSEWKTNTISGAGVPYGVTIGNYTGNSVVSFGNTGNNHQMLGTLVINSGSTSGNGLILDSASGGDLYIAGAFTAQQTASQGNAGFAGGFNGNGRTVYLTSNASQTITGPTTGTQLTIPYLGYGTGGTSNVVTLGSNLTISAPNGGNSIIAANTDSAAGTATGGYININADTLTIGTAGQSNSVSSGTSIGTPKGTHILYFKDATSTKTGAVTLNGNAGTINMSMDNGGGYSTTTALTVNHPGVTLFTQMSLLGNLTLQSGTLLFKPTSSTKSLALGGGLISIGGNVDASSSNATVIFYGTSAQLIPVGTFTNNINKLQIGNATASVVTINQPVTVASNFTVSSGASCAIGTNDTLTLNGPISGTGVITGSDSSSMIVAGTGTLYFDQSTLGTSNRLRNLKINSSGTVTLGNALNIHGTMTSTTGTLASAGNLILLSDSTGTGRVDQVLGSITGNVTVQRYITAKSVRKYSFIGSPVSQSIRNAWQQQIYITGAGTGGTPCGSTAGDGGTTDKYNSNGFDVTITNTPSMYTYVPTPVKGSRYTSVPNSESTNLTPGTGYSVNIRGNRNSPNTTCANQLATSSPLAPEAVTLSATGTLTTGNVTVALNNPSIHAYTLLANPYPSQISYTAFQLSNSITNNKMWTFSPFGNGNYTTFSQGAIVNGATGYDNTHGDYIAIGQAFFVEANTSGSVTFHESHKVSGLIPNTKYFGANTTKTIRVGLMSATNSTLDEILIRYNSEGTRDYNPNWDAITFNNASQVLVSLKGSDKLAIATHPDATVADTSELGLTSKTAGSFTLSFSDVESIGPSQKIILIDKFRGIAEDIRSNPTYAFNITSDTLSQGNKRFLIILGGAKPLPVNFASVTANKSGTAVAVKWLMADQSSISSYSVERSTDGVNFKAIAAVKVTASSTYQVQDTNIPASAMLYYRIRAIGVDGSYKYSNVVKLNTNNLPLATISIYPNPVHDKLKVTLNNGLNGTYKVRIITIAGIVAHSQANVLIDGNELTLDAINLAGGIYMLELTDEKGNKLMDKFVKE